MVLGSHAKTRAMYSTPPWPSLTASTAAYRRRSFSDNHPKKRCIFSSISAEYPSMLYSLRHNLLWRKDTTAQACREVIPDHILSDYRCEIQEMIAEGHKAFARLLFSGMHRAEFFGYQPTGKRVEWVGAAVFTFAGEKISALWVLGDVHGLLQQLANNARP